MKNMYRRRIKKRKRPNEKTKMKFTSVLVIMILAVAMGYLTATYIIGPILGYNADESPLKVSKEAEESNESNESNETTELAESTESTESAGTIGEGYALQFGAYSTKEAAQKLVDSLTLKGIKAEIVEKDGQFKVISPIIRTKDEALNQLNDIKDKEVEDVFIASF